MKIFEKYYVHQQEVFWIKKYHPSCSILKKEAKERERSELGSAMECSISFFGFL